MIKKISKEQMLLLAENSTSIHDLSIKIGYSDKEINKKVKKILVEMDYDLSSFKNKNLSPLNNKEKLEKIVKESFSYKEVLSKFNLSHHTETLKKYLKIFSISIEHFNRNRYTNYNRVKKKSVIEVDDFIINSKINNKYIKKLILQENLIPYVCATEGCGNSGQWLGKSITLQLEHKNGIRNDHRLENLEFLCPNCHTQTGTYCSKNSTLLKKLNILSNNYESKEDMNHIYRFFIYEKNIVSLLNKISTLHSYAELLNAFNFTVSSKNTKYIKNILEIYKNDDNVRVFNKNRILKNRDGVKFPAEDVLRKMLENSSYSAVGRQLNCSDNAIRKHLSKFSK